MHPRLSIVTLGVADVARSRAFYERLGWRPSAASQDAIAFFQLGALGLALFARDALAADAGVPAMASGPGLTLAQNYASPAEVDEAYAAALAAGATSLKPPHPAFWGGYSGYVADPDGFAWELCHNPFFALREDGSVTLPPP